MVTYFEMAVGKTLILGMAFYRLTRFSLHVFSITYMHNSCFVFKISVVPKGNVFSVLKFT